jgi:tetratricopeptide (TPR) repeat protein
MNRLFCFLIAGAALALPAVAVSLDEVPATVDDGIQLFLHNDLGGAMTALTAVTAAEPGNARAQAWLAETLRRQGNLDGARAAADAALAADSCQALAHTVIAELLFPIRPGASPDPENHEKALRRFLKAAECDPGDGNPWLSIWVEALRRGDRDLEQRALQRLHDTGFFTPTALAFTRWLFGSLPRGAVILTNGDMDTYPMAMLQAMEGFRTDVAVVNYSLLNLDWYARLVSDRYGLPLPRKMPEVHHDAEGNLVLKARQFVTYWLENPDRLKRPFTMAVTVPEMRFTPEYPSHLQLAGGFYRYLPEAAPEPVDASLVEQGVFALDPRQFSGPTVSAQDRSPIRRAGNDRLLDNVAAAALQRGMMAYTAKDYDTAKKMALWAESFDAATPAALPEIMAQTIQVLKAGKPPEGEGSGTSGTPPGGN